MHNNLLISFVRNPELGKVKTRLAKKIGAVNALEVYNDLLEHTKSTMLATNCQKAVFYSEHVAKNDMWSGGEFLRFTQCGGHLGERMSHAFQTGFNLGFDSVILIGSDLATINKTHIKQALDRLKRCHAVLGPAEDGGYYLIGMNRFHQEFFYNKAWGTDTVLNDTLKDTSHLKIDLLEPLNDVDTFEDLQGLKQFKTLFDEYKR